MLVLFNILLYNFACCVCSMGSIFIYINSKKMYIKKYKELYYTLLIFFIVIIKNAYKSKYKLI